jgi:hypothetical protein
MKTYWELKEELAEGRKQYLKPNDVVSKKEYYPTAKGPRQGSVSQFFYDEELIKPLQQLAKGDPVVTAALDGAFIDDNVIVYSGKIRLPTGEKNMAEFEDDQTVRDVYKDIAKWAKKNKKRIMPKES